MNKNPKGKLYAKYYNSMRTLKSSGLISSSTHAKLPTENSFKRKHDLHFGMLINIQNNTIFIFMIHR